MEHYDYTKEYTQSKCNGIGVIFSGSENAFMAQKSFLPDQKRERTYEEKREARMDGVQEGGRDEAGTRQELWCHFCDFCYCCLLGLFACVFVAFGFLYLPCVFFSQSAATMVQNREHTSIGTKRTMMYKEIN